MFLELILSLFIGILAGIFSGLFPGIHINLISFFAASSILPIDSEYLIVFIVSMSITHTFLDFIPSVFLGCPDTETQLSVLPGHKLLKEGRGYEAVMLSAKGCLIAIFVLLIVTFPLIFLLSKTYPYIKIIIPYLLIGSSAVLIFTEKNKKNALLVFILTGLLGLSVLNLELKEPLLPLLTGLFGASSLILSIKTKTQIPKQNLSMDKTKFSKPILSSLIASPLCGFLPGLGSGQASILGNTVSKNNRKEFIILLGATNTLVLGFSFISLYTISKARTGIAVAIQKLVGTPSLEILCLILGAVFFSGIISFFITKKLAKFFSKKITKISYRTLSIITLLFLSIIILLISSFSGFFIFIVSTFTGIYCISKKTRRTNMMGCLLIPTILLYLF